MTYEEYNKEYNRIEKASIPELKAAVAHYGRIVGGCMPVDKYPYAIDPREKAGHSYEESLFNLAEGMLLAKT